VEYVFLDNGAFRGSVTSEGAMVSQFTGKWSLRGDSILYEYTGDTMGTIPVGTKDRDTLIAVETDHYVIEAADGSRRKYVRVNASSSTRGKPPRERKTGSHSVEPKGHSGGPAMTLAS
jgi:hypothetical protein